MICLQFCVASAHLVPLRSSRALFPRPPPSDSPRGATSCEVPSFVLVSHERPTWKRLFFTFRWCGTRVAPQCDATTAARAFPARGRRHRQRPRAVLILWTHRRAARPRAVGHDGPEAPIRCRGRSPGRPRRLDRGDSTDVAVGGHCLLTTGRDSGTSPAVLLNRTATPLQGRRHRPAIDRLAIRRGCGKGHGRNTTTVLSIGEPLRHRAASDRSAAGVEDGG